MCTSGLTSEPVAASAINIMNSPAKAAQSVSRIKSWSFSSSFWSSFIDTFFAFFFTLIFFPSSWSFLKFVTMCRKHENPEYDIFWNIQALILSSFWLKGLPFQFQAMWQKMYQGWILNKKNWLIKVGAFNRNKYTNITQMWCAFECSSKTFKFCQKMGVFFVLCFLMFLNCRWMFSQIFKSNHLNFAEQTTLLNNYF